MTTKDAHQNIPAAHPIIAPYARPLTVPVGDPDDGLGCVAFPHTDKLEVSGLAEGMLDARIKVGQGLEDVFSGQTFGDGKVKGQDGTRW